MSYALAIQRKHVVAPDKAPHAAALSSAPPPACALGERVAEVSRQDEDEQRERAEAEKERVLLRLKQFFDTADVDTDGHMTEKESATCVAPELFLVLRTATDVFLMLEAT